RRVHLRIGHHRRLHHDAAEHQPELHREVAVKGAPHMNRFLALFLAAALAGPASAATTWAEITTLPSWSRGASATCTTGTESAPAAATDGIDLGGFAGFSVTIVAAGAMTA